MEKIFDNFLMELSKYVLVVGSFARYQEDASGLKSDIDCYVLSRPEDEVDCEIGNDTYMPEVIALINKYGYRWESMFVGYVTIGRQTGVPRQVELATHFRVPRDAQLFRRYINGAWMICAVDDKDYNGLRYSDGGVN